jgi:hypothetical protein
MTREILANRCIVGPWDRIAEKGQIIELVVSRLETEYKKPTSAFLQCRDEKLLNANYFHTAAQEPYLAEVLLFLGIGL